MTRSTRFLLAALVIASFALCFGVSAGMAQDLVVVAPNTAKVLVDNDQVRILEVLDKPGDIEPMHAHPAYAAVFLSATRIKVTTPDGKVVEKDRKPGEVQYSGPVTHTVENVGTADFHVIIVELKK
jgi:quercetin dioxygenase-like cupin family protein